MFKFLKQTIIIVVVIGITAVIVRATGDYIDSDINIDGCLEGMVFVPSSDGGFCIDIYEASAGKDCLYRDEFNADKTRVNLKTKDCIAVSEGQSIPWRYISRDQAVLACAKSGKRLATAEEWYQASLGTPDENELWEDDDCQVSNNWADQPGKSGSGENCVSSVGAYDMIGNVWEWVDGTVDNLKYEDIILPEQGHVQAMGAGALPASTAIETNIDYNNDYFWIKNTGVRAIARGGYWNNRDEAGVYSVYAVTKPSYTGAGIGFRCVR